MGTQACVGAISEGEVMVRAAAEIDRFRIGEHRAIVVRRHEGDRYLVARAEPLGVFRRRSRHTVIDLHRIVHIFLWTPHELWLILMQSSDRASQRVHHHQLRAIIVGAGFAGGQHVDALRRLNVHVAAVVGSDPARARAAASRLGVEHGMADLDSALAVPDVDVVHVTVPNAQHVPVVTAALAAGKHVICEKPLATSAEDAFALARCARQAAGMAFLCHNYRFYAMTAEFRSRMQRGDLGRIHLVRGAYLQDWLLDPRSTSWRVDPNEGGASRTVADIGTHWIDLAETVIGRRVEAVTARLGTVHASRPDWAHVSTFERTAKDGWVDIQTEDQAVLLLEFEGGTLGAVTLSQVAAGHHNDLWVGVDGDAGSAEWRQERPDELRLALRDGPVEIIARDRAALSPGAGGLTHLPAGHGEGWGDALRNLLGAAYAEIRGERSSEEDAVAPLPTFDDGARHVAFVEAALRSNRTGEWVRIGEITAAVDDAARREVHS